MNGHLVIFTLRFHIRFALPRTDMIQTLASRPTGLVNFLQFLQDLLTQTSHIHV